MHGQAAQIRMLLASASINAALKIQRASHPSAVFGPITSHFSHHAALSPSKKDTPASSPDRMKRRWRVVLLRAKGEILGEVEAHDVASAKAAAAVRFDLDEVQRGRIIVQELA